MLCPRPKTIAAAVGWGPLKQELKRAPPDMTGGFCEGDERVLGREQQIKDCQLCDGDAPQPTRISTKADDAMWKFRKPVKQLKSISHHDKMKAQQAQTTMVGALADLYLFLSLNAFGCLISVCSGFVCDFDVVNVLR